MSLGAAIEFIGVTKDFALPDSSDRVRALDAVDLEVTAGTTVGPVGPNGSGKSTMLKVMAGIVRPTEGTVRIMGKPVGSPETGSRLGFVPAGRGLLEPQIVLLDEPFAGLDPLGRDILESILCDVGVCGGTVVFSSHLMIRIEEICESLVMLDRGRNMLSGSVRELVGGRSEPSRGLDELYREQWQKTRDFA